LAARRTIALIACGFSSQANHYMFRRWDDFMRFLGDGRICLTNNAAEGALGGFALGRKSWLFAFPNAVPVVPLSRRR
jgi:hypothetical protein